MLRGLVTGAGAVALVAPAGAGAAVRTVGPGHAYAKPCAAIAAAKPGDTVRIDARGNGGYDGDVCASSVARLTIEGFNGRARIDAAGRSHGGKGIWVLSGPRTVVQRVELTGAKVPDRNGAGIRLEGDGDLTLRDAVLRGNENGILVTASATRSDVVVERTTFSLNGAGDGQSHNVYVARARSFAMRRSVSREALVGHLVKSRAATNVVTGNRLIGGEGTASYELELPDGGAARVTGNLIQQGPRTENPAMLSYAAESARNPRSRLRVERNTFVSDRPGGATAIAVGAAMRGTVEVVRNVSAGQTRFVDRSARLRANCLRRDPRFVAPAALDFRLDRTSPCRGAGATGWAARGR